MPALREAREARRTDLLRDVHRRGRRSAAIRRNPAFLLEDGELAELMAPFTILRSREGEIDGRFIASIVAERPTVECSARMNQLFQRKPIADLVIDERTRASLKRVLGAGDLVMLAIGAVIGAGIFGAIGTAAAGQVAPDGKVIRYAAGPALIFSFILLGGACALAALCYAELAAMIPQAGSAYAYSYATLGELVAWIIGWDLMLEYAVGNVAVAISWGDYFNTLVRGVGVDLPAWLTTGYRTALLSSNPDVSGLLNTAPHVLGMPILVNLPAFGIVMLITWLLLRGARESATANTVMVVIKLPCWRCSSPSARRTSHPANYTPFAPNGFTGIHQGAAIVFFAYIGFDAISTAAEETRTRSATCRSASSADWPSARSSTSWSAR